MRLALPRTRLPVTGIGLTLAIALLALAPAAAAHAQIQPTVDDILAAAQQVNAETFTLSPDNLANGSGPATLGIVSTGGMGFDHPSARAPELSVGGSSVSAGAFSILSQKAASCSATTMATAAGAVEFRIVFYNLAGTWPEYVATSYLGVPGTTTQNGVDVTVNAIPRLKTDTVNPLPQRASDFALGNIAFSGTLTFAVTTGALLLPDVDQVVALMGLADVQELINLLGLSETPATISQDEFLPVFTSSEPSVTIQSVTLNPQRTAVDVVIDNPSSLPFALSCTNWWMELSQFSALQGSRGGVGVTVAGTSLPAGALSVSNARTPGVTVPNAISETTGGGGGGGSTGGGSSGGGSSSSGSGSSGGSSGGGSGSSGSGSSGSGSGGSIIEQGGQPASGSTGSTGLSGGSTGGSRNGPSASADAQAARNGARAQRAARRAGQVQAAQVTTNNNDDNNRRGRWRRGGRGDNNGNNNNNSASNNTGGGRSSGGSTSSGGGSTASALSEQPTVTTEQLGAEMRVSAVRLTDRHFARTPAVGLRMSDDGTSMVGRVWIEVVVLVDTTPDTIGEVTVSLRVPGQSEPILVTLRESGPNTGVFRSVSDGVAFTIPVNALFAD